MSFASKPGEFNDLPMQAFAVALAVIEVVDNIFLLLYIPSGCGMQLSTEPSSLPLDTMPIRPCHVRDATCLRAADPSMYDTGIVRTSSHFS